MGDFHNPYNFVPALSRKKIKESKLGDHPPSSHAKYHPKLWSGKIGVKLITKTPLLVPDASTVTENDGHKIYDVRRDPLDPNKPYLPATSIKGMLRTAYEIVTNSRYSIFVDHEDRLAYRMSARQGIKVIPARVEANDKVRLFPGTSHIDNDGSPTPGDPVYAACLPQYQLRKCKIDANAIRDQNNKLPVHGQKVKVWLEKFYKEGRDGRIAFRHWRVLKLDVLERKELTQPPSRGNFGRYRPVPNEDMILVDGYVCITNKNIDRKHDERVFFDCRENEISCSLTDDLRKQWRELISNYQKVHEDEICKKHKDSPPALNCSEWSRHIKKENSYSLAFEAQELRPGTLCYAKVEDVSRDNSEINITGLYPVMIARELFENSPRDLLSKGLEPALKIDDLSPADRVFGWVKPPTKSEGEEQKVSSYKGNLRIGKIDCIGEVIKGEKNTGYITKKSPIRSDFGQLGFPLSILGQPQPQQTRFYAAKNMKGEPLDNQTKKEKGYKKGSGGLRGRKVYPHHKSLPVDYWNIPNNSKEWFRFGGERDDQNRSIKAWVEPSITFQFDIDVTNLSEVELGALLWLLTLPEDYFLRLGNGKPLGFGSVHLELDIETTDLRQGNIWKQYYKSLIPQAKPMDFQIDKSIQRFKEEIESKYNQNFFSIPFIQAFSKNCRGFNDNKPIHYPRNSTVRTINGEGFDWFVENERNQQVSLPSLLDQDEGLSYYQ